MSAHGAWAACAVGAGGAGAAAGRHGQRRPAGQVSAPSDTAVAFPATVRAVRVPVVANGE